MNTPLNFRFAAALASIAITFSLLSGLAGMAKPQASNVLLAQAPTSVTIR